MVAAQVDVAPAETVVSDHLFLALQGVLMCSLNEIMLYSATARVSVSGLVPLVYTLLTAMKVFVGAIFLGLPIRALAGNVLVLARRRAARPEPAAGAP